MVDVESIKNNLTTNVNEKKKGTNGVGRGGETANWTAMDQTNWTGSCPPSRSRPKGHRSNVVFKPNIKKKTGSISFGTSQIDTVISLTIVGQKKMTNPMK